MKILFLGEIGYGQTSLMRLRAFERLGHIVHGVNTIDPWKRVSWTRRQWHRWLQRGPVVDEINAMVFDAARRFRPDWVWAEKQEFLTVETLVGLRKVGARLVHFTPDPYFSLPWKRTRLMDQAIGAFDVLVYCKSYERADYEALGKPLVYMPLGFCDETHRPLHDGDARWKAQIGFLGGWEPRREHLLHAVAAADLELKLWGGYWEFLHDGRRTLRRQIILRQLAGADGFRFHRDALLARAHQGGEVYGDDYARALTGAKIGLGLLRQVWPDQHTTRSFEIPACRSMLLADRTDEHQSLFEAGKEAEYFESTEELVDKATYYARHDVPRQRIADAGYERCIRSRYAYIYRLKEAMNEAIKL